MYPIKIKIYNILAKLRHSKQAVALYFVVIFVYARDFILLISFDVLFYIFYIFNFLMYLLFFKFAQIDWNLILAQNVPNTPNVEKTQIDKKKT